ncbi:hypothetical protein AVME950_02695 [Acidovorax sp. SUPP950]|uniref:hypothetical protein n=1 Tax=Acidovorax sp. SUPP950 TaxID=511901 RepID=UPI0023D051CB|nr:hypothetical protein [Acidovorax sp. SUPP950]GKS73757.1 hypothetical protein AVME950_02695 [Acidovorax sp. SUPP950]
MPRIDAPNPSAQAASSASQHTQAEPSDVRRRSSARHQAPEGLQQRADAPAAAQHAPQPARVRTGLQALRQTAQAAVDGGTVVAHAGARIGAAAGAAFLADPVRTTGIAMLAGGSSYALINHQRANDLETVRGSAIAFAGYTLMATRAFFAMLPGAAQAVADGIQAAPGALRDIAEGIQAAPGALRDMAEAFQALAQAAMAEGREPQISQELAVAALGMILVMGEPDPDDPEDLSQEVGRHVPQVVDHLMDLRQGSASETVHAAALAANEVPAQLVRNLHALVTADSPVLSQRPNSRGARPN